MPTGYYVRTDEYRKKLSEARKKYLNKDDNFVKWKEKLSSINLGNKYAEGNINWVGRKHKEESKEKMKQKQLGVRPGNYLDGRSHNPIRRKFKNKKPYSHYVYCSQPGNVHRIPDGMVIHHKDLNPKNDSPDNLVMIPDDFHRSFHNQIIMKVKRGEIR